MPIFAGNGMVQILTEVLQADGLLDAFDMRVRMLRPVHWDDGLAVIGRRDDAGPAGGKSRPSGPKARKRTI